METSVISLPVNQCLLTTAELYTSNWTYLLLGSPILEIKSASLVSIIHSAKQIIVGISSCILKPTTLRKLHFDDSAPIYIGTSMTTVSTLPHPTSQLPHFPTFYLN